MPFPLLAILLVLLALVVLFAIFLVVRRWLGGGTGSPVFDALAERVRKRVSIEPGGSTRRLLILRGNPPPEKPPGFL
jgi:hypothetical protein